MRKIYSGLDEVGAFVERRSRLLLGLLLLLAFLCWLGTAAQQYLWYDEVVLVRTGALPHWNDIWRFYASGRDTVGPLSALVIHGALKLPFGPEIDARLPSVLAFFVLLVCTYMYVRRRYPATYALAALFPLLTKPMGDLAWTAKGYMIEVAALAFAMTAWQSATAGRHRPWTVLGMWLGLAVAISAHSFAVFAFIAFAGAQLVQDLRRRRLDVPIWLALVLSPVVLFPTLHGTMLASHIYRNTFWSKPTPSLARAVYADFLAANPHAIICVFACLIVSILLQRRSQTATEEQGRQGFSAAEWTFVSVLALLPVYALIGSYALRVYRDVYVIAFIIGVSILTMCLLAEYARESRVSGIVLLLTLFVSYFASERGAAFWGVRLLLRPYNVHAHLAETYAQQDWVQILKKSQLPVLAGDHMVYTQFDFYASPDLRRRLWNVTDYREVNAYPQSTTAQLNFLSFGKDLSFQTMDLQDFLTGNPHCLLLVGTDKNMWLPSYVLKQEEEGRATLQLLGPNFAAPPNVYDVQFSRMPDFPPGEKRPAFLPGSATDQAMSDVGSTTKAVAGYE